MKVAKVTPSKLANTDEEYKTLLESAADWIVRDVDDLHQLRREHKTGALAKLSDSAFEKFIESCKFMNGGIAGGDIAGLSSEIGIKTTLSMFSHFGITTELALSWQERGCVSNDCVQDITQFCSHINCHHRAQVPDQ